VIAVEAVAAKEGNVARKNPLKTSVCRTWSR
jgi:hypothetical protein